jgi:putative transposase
MKNYRGMRSLQLFVSVQASVLNHFNSEYSLSSKAKFKQNHATALNESLQLGAT